MGSGVLCGCVLMHICTPSSSCQFNGSGRFSLTELILSELCALIGLKFCRITSIVFLIHDSILQRL